MLVEISQHLNGTQPLKFYGIRRPQLIVVVFQWLRRQLLIVYRYSKIPPSQKLLHLPQPLLQHLRIIDIPNPHKPLILPPNPSISWQKHHSRLLLQRHTQLLSPNSPPIPHKLDQRSGARKRPLPSQIALMLLDKVIKNISINLS